MARLIDNSLPYFPMYCDFFTNRQRMYTAIKGEYGNDGVLFYIYMQCELFNVGYYIDLNKDTRFISDAAGVLGISSNLIRQVLKFLCKESMIDNKLFAQDNIITSKEFQLQYQHGMKGRNLKRDIEVDGRFWLLNENETEGLIKVRRFSKTPENKGINSEEKPINSGNITQCKVKESNAMENKVRGAAPPPVSAPAIDRNFLVEKFGMENVVDYENRFERWKQKKRSVNVSMYETIYKWLQQDGVQKPVNKSSFNMSTEMDKIKNRYKED